MKMDAFKHKFKHKEIIWTEDDDGFLNQPPIDTAERLANDHVEWFLQSIKPLLIDHFIHGYKHGKEDKGGVT